MPHRCSILPAKTLVPADPGTDPPEFPKGQKAHQSNDPHANCPGPLQPGCLRLLLGHLPDQYRNVKEEKEGAYCTNTQSKNFQHSCNIFLFHKNTSMIKFIFHGGILSPHYSFVNIILLYLDIFLFLQVIVGQLITCFTASSIHVHGASRSHNTGRPFYGQRSLSEPGTARFGHGP